MKKYRELSLTRAELRTGGCCGGKSAATQRSPKVGPTSKMTAGPKRTHGASPPRDWTDAVVRTAALVADATESTRGATWRAAFVAAVRTLNATSRAPGARIDEHTALARAQAASWAATTGPTVHDAARPAGLPPTVSLDVALVRGGER